MINDQDIAQYVVDQQQFGALQVSMLQTYFHAHSAHIDGSHIQLATSHSKLYSLGSDNVIIALDPTDQTTQAIDIQNPHHHQITAACFHPRQTNAILIGTSSGKMWRFNSIREVDFEQVQPFYSANQHIEKLQYDSTGTIVLIVLQKSQNIFIYQTLCKKIVKLPLDNQKTFVVNAWMAPNLPLICILSSEGKILFVKMSSLTFQKTKEQDSESEDPFAWDHEKIEKIDYLSIYSICDGQTIENHPYLRGCFATMKNNSNESRQLKFLVGGDVFLNEIEIGEEMKLDYKAKSKIREESKMIMVCGLERECSVERIVICTETGMGIWDYARQQKILNIAMGGSKGLQITQMTCISTQKGNCFAFIFDPLQDTNIYSFNHELLLKSEEKQMALPISKKVERTFLEESKAGKIVSCYPQQLLDQSYEEYQKYKFRFYNSHGCIIERIQADDRLVLELEFHDKSKIFRMSLPNNHSILSLFAIKKDTVVLASSTTIYFQNQKQLKSDFQWDYKWIDVQAIAIGSLWVAASNRQEIRILDFAGNELHSVSLGRKLMGLAAYEDRLVVVFHSSIPMWGCQSFGMKIYKVSTFGIELERESTVPIEPNSLMKWFGFSEEGMLVCQDEAQNVRYYQYNLDQWQTVFQLNPKEHRLFIQHIENYQIYGFKIQQKSGEHCHPRVIPRSLPRKMNLNVSNFEVDFFTEEENSHLKKLILKQMFLSHEEFRYSEWYKLKYSRRKQNADFYLSQNIKSQEQIESMKMGSDLQLIQYARKFIFSQPNNLRVAPMTIAQTFITLANRLAYYQQTKTDLRKQILSHLAIDLPRSFAEFQFQIKKHKKEPINKLNQINYLEMLAE